MYFSFLFQVLFFFATFLLFFLCYQLILILFSFCSLIFWFLIPCFTLKFHWTHFITYFKYYFLSNNFKHKYYYCYLLILLKIKVWFIIFIHVGFSKVFFLIFQTLSQKWILRKEAKTVGNFVKFVFLRTECEKCEILNSTRCIKRNHD